MFIGRLLLGRNNKNKKERKIHTMGTLSLADLTKARKLQHGLPAPEDRLKFKQEVVIGQDGIYLSYLSDFFDIVYKKESFDSRTTELLKNVKIPEVKEGLTISEKIPSGTIHRMVAWYRHVEEEYGTEATMQVFYDVSEGTKDFPKEIKDKYEGAIKREGKFVYVVPEQVVNGGHVSFDGNSFPNQVERDLYRWALSNYEPVLNIHSHNSMGAFWSGTDDANELPLYTRLCLVVGKVHTEKPQFRFSWNFEGRRHHFESTIDTFIEPLKAKTEVGGLGYEVERTIGFDEALGYIDYDRLGFDSKWDDRLKVRNGVGVYAQIGTVKEVTYSLTEEEQDEIDELKGTGDYIGELEEEDTTYIGDYEELLEDWGNYENKGLVEKEVPEFTRTSPVNQLKDGVIGEKVTDKSSGEVDKSLVEKTAENLIGSKDSHKRKNSTFENFKKKMNGKRML